MLWAFVGYVTLLVLVFDDRLDFRNILLRRQFPLVERANDLWRRPQVGPLHCVMSPVAHPKGLSIDLGRWQGLMKWIKFFFSGGPKHSWKWSGLLWNSHKGTLLPIASSAPNIHWNRSWSQIKEDPGFSMMKWPPKAKVINRPACTWQGHSQNH